MQLEYNSTNCKTARRILAAMLLCVTMCGVLLGQSGDIVVIDPAKQPRLADFRDNAEPEYEHLLERCVALGGRVDYKSLAEEPNRTAGIIDAYLSALDARYAELSTDGQGSFVENDKAEAIAIYVNAHNAAMLRAVLLYYPFARVSDCPADIFEDVRFSIFGGNFSIGQIDRHCRQIADWRVPFLLYRPTRTGPALRNHLLQADELNDRLDTAVVNYICSCAGMRIDHEGQRVLVGALLWQKRNELIKNYRERTAGDHEPTLTETIIPIACRQTRSILATVLHYTPIEMPNDDRIDDIDRRQWYDSPPSNVPQEESYPCGRHGVRN